MEKPVNLPEHLEKYLKSNNDNELFISLKSKDEELIPFLLFSMDDESFISDHQDFIKMSLQHLTELNRIGKIGESDLKNIRKRVIKQAHQLKNLLPLDLQLKVEDHLFSGNSLLYASLSPDFQSMIRHTKDNTIVLEGITLKDFQFIEEFLFTDHVETLWKEDAESLKIMHQRVTEYGLDDLGILIEKVLKRYIERDNMILMLIEAHKNGWTLLRHSCYAFINGLNLGVYFHQSKPSVLAFEFLDFKWNALAIFDQVKEFITEYVISSDLNQENEFSRTINECPKLTRLNLAHTKNFDEKIFAFKKDLKELDLSSCRWLDVVRFQEIVSYYSALNFLSLSDNLQLNYRGFVQLSHLKYLRTLNISRNPEIRDEEFKLIIESTPHVIDLDCSDCKNITDRGFFELANHYEQLIFLNLASCAIKDGLLIEIAVRLRHLEEINLSKCSKLNDKGIYEFVMQSRALKTMILKEGQLKTETLNLLSKNRNYLKIIFD